MRALASFIMRGRSQAALVAGAFAVLSLIVPLSGLVSSAAVALVTLRQGVGEGLFVGLLAGLASGLFAFAALGSPVPALGLALALWLPVWVLGAVLHHTRSLVLTVHATALIGLLIVVLIHLQAADPATYWAELLEPLREAMVQSQVVDAPASEAMVAQLARWMTGAFAATFSFQALLALFAGRWWQAMLYNPGGFGAEFRALRVHPVAGWLGLGLIAVVLLRSTAQWAAELLLLATPLFFLQGLAVTHSLAAAPKARHAWLIGFYALLVLAMPYAELLVAAFGLADIWVDVRERTRARGGGR